jgi:hypothetical protein
VAEKGRKLNLTDEERERRRQAMIERNKANAGKPRKRRSKMPTDAEIEAGLAKKAAAGDAAAARELRQWRILREEREGKPRDSAQTALLEELRRELAEQYEEREALVVDEGEPVTSEAQEEATDAEIEAEYKAVHDWLRSHAVKTGTCSRCGTDGPTQWALKRGREYERDVDAFDELCRACHSEQDRKTECVNGHDLTLPNARTKPSPSRPSGQCRQCVRDLVRRRKREVRGNEPWRPGGSGHPPKQDLLNSPTRPEPELPEPEEDEEPSPEEDEPASDDAIEPEPVKERAHFMLPAGFGEGAQFPAAPSRSGPYLPPGSRRPY